MNKPIQDHPDITFAMRTGYGVRTPEPEIHCPVCGETLQWDDTIYKISGTVVACSNCIETMAADDYREQVIEF